MNILRAGQTVHSTALPTSPNRLDSPLILSAGIADVGALEFVITASCGTRGDLPVRSAAYR